LRPAANVAVFASADHDELRRRAALVVTHGGHGTLLRALTYGLPMVVIPGLGGDQPVNAKAVEDWGVGRALPGNATAQMMREAVHLVLATPVFGQKARTISLQLAAADGASGAADEVESQLLA
jgi:UDP:flavonoid glycosyltransferase YjiC (YdhE family)